jgi:hypothetical protein
MSGLRLGIQSLDLVRETHDEFVAALVVDDDGCAEGTGDAFLLVALESVGASAGVPFGLGVFPFGFPRLLIHRDDGGIFVGTVIENAKIAEEDGGGGVAPGVALRAEVALPEFVAVEVVAIDAGRSEGDHDAFAVRDG